MRTRLGTLLGLVALAILVLVAVPAQPASACDCSTPTDEELLETVDAIFTGRLLGRLEPPAGPDGSSSSADFATLRFEVEAVYKGEVTVEQAVVTEQSGASCGLGVAGEGPFLVFARDDHYDQPVPEGAFYSGMCGGTRAMEGQPVPASFGAPQAPANRRPPALPAGGPTAIDEAPEDTTRYVIGTAVATIVVVVGGVALLVGRRRRRSA